MSNEEPPPVPSTADTQDGEDGPKPPLAAEVAGSADNLAAALAATTLSQSNPGSRPPSPGNEAVDIWDFSTPPASPRVRKTLRAPLRGNHLPLPSRLRAERAATRLEAAAMQAEAAATRIAEDAARTRAQAVHIEYAARRIGQHAEKVCNMLQRAGEAARLIGQDADELVAMLARPSASGDSGPSASGDSYASLVTDEEFAQWFVQQKFMAFVS
ncbi:hypothetical protein B0H15DRAFT_952613 [Mycena belliarum]|uniref:Uncharacterized protein n=1 Tax=Mycena belliarum TaxID=1033014 RepID=A0AAD6XMW1_9AGAR|nr:hypothetical protein B0H15DRAFT_952613 [Mycena belliae]